VLLLGLAAGSVGRAVRALDPDAEIVGVELDREVVRLARRHFGLDGLGIELVVGDALEFLRTERRRFDLIVEDLFVGPSRSVRKPEWLLGEGYPLIRRRLRRGGYGPSGHEKQCDGEPHESDRGAALAGAGVRHCGGRMVRPRIIRCDGLVPSTQLAPSA